MTMELERFYVGSLEVKVLICNSTQIDTRKEYHCNIDPWKGRSVLSELPCMGIFTIFIYDDEVVGHVPPCSAKFLLDLFYDSRICDLIW